MSTATPQGALSADQQPPLPRRSLIAGLVIVSLFAALLVACEMLWWHFTIDDTYITLRYAQNLARSGQLTWNIGGVHAQGYTSIAWVLLLFVPALLHLPLLTTAKVLSLSSLALAALLIQRVARREAGFAPVWAWAFAAMVCSYPFFALQGATGMETMSFACCLVWVMDRTLVWADGPTVRNGAVLSAASALCFLLRPEGALLALLIILPFCAGKRLADLVRVALPVAAAVAGFLAFSRAYYGLWLPLSWHVKQGGPFAGLTDTWGALLLASWLAVPAGCPPYRHRLKWALLPAGVLLAYYTTVLPIMNTAFRYQAPALPLLACAAMPSLRVLARHTRRLAVAVAIFSVATPLTAAVWWLESGAATHYAHAYMAQLDATYVPFGKILRPYRSAVRLAMADDGVAAFEAQTWTLDTYSLNSPQVVLHGLTAGMLLRDRVNLAVTVVNSRQHAVNADRLQRLLPGAGFTCLGVMSNDPSYEPQVWRRGPLPSALIAALDRLPHWTACPR